MKEIALYYYFMNAIKISVVPAKAGIHRGLAQIDSVWIPAFAGTTDYVLLTVRLCAFMQLPCKRFASYAIRCAATHQFQCASSRYLSTAAWINSLLIGSGSA